MTKITRPLLILLLTNATLACNAGNSTAQSVTNSENEIHQLKIVNGYTNFSNLPANSDIKRMTNATVGLIITDLNNEMSSCTGIAIKPDVFVTSGHCFKNGAKQIKIVVNPADTTHPEYTINATNFKIQNKYDSKIKNDIAMIQINDSKVPSLNHLSVPNEMLTVADMWGNNYLEQSSVDSELSIFKDSSSKIYAVGWRSYNKFQYKEASIKDTRLTLYQSDNDHYFGSVGTPVTILLESGDSGGPWFICNPTGEKCYLFGLTSSISPNNIIKVTPI